MRIASLSPSATEIAFALGLGTSLVGVSHDSDWPLEAVSVRHLTAPLDTALERRVRLDVEALREADPELIVAPATTELVVDEATDPLAAIEAAVPGAETIVLDPTSVEGILHSISTVGAMTRTEAGALRLVERLRARLGRLERRVQRRREQGRRPTRVVALTGIEPPVSCGRWIPEQVRRAGGWELLGREGEPPVATTWDAVRDVDPEAIVLMAIGCHLDQVVELWSAAPRPAGWDELEAVRRGQVFAVDAASYFLRPGPRVVEGIGLLAEILDPDGFMEASPLGSWTPLD